MLMALARKKVVAPVSGARVALAEVIKERDSTREVANTCHTALARATTALDAARRTRIAAEDALAEAPAAARKYMIASARGETVEKPKSLKECRADLEDAQNDFEAATAAVGAMKEEVQKFGDPSFYEQKAKSLAATVIHAAPATAMLISEAFELRRQLNEKWQLLQWLSEAVSGARREGDMRSHRVRPQTGALHLSLCAGHAGERAGPLCADRGCEGRHHRAYERCRHRNRDRQLPGDARL